MIQLGSQNIGQVNGNHFASTCQTGEWEHHCGLRLYHRVCKPAVYNVFNKNKTKAWWKLIFISEFLNGMLASMVHTVIFRKIFCRPGFVIERIMICFEHTNIRRQYIVHRTHTQYQLHVCDLPSKLGHTAVFLLCNQNQAYSTVTTSTRSISSHNDIYASEVKQLVLSVYGF
jgi:hypothetical protein